MARLGEGSKQNKINLCLAPILINDQPSLRVFLFILQMNSSHTFSEFDRLFFKSPIAQVVTTPTNLVERNVAVEDDRIQPPTADRKFNILLALQNRIKSANTSMVSPSPMVLGSPADLSAHTPLAVLERRTGPAVKENVAKKPGALFLYQLL